MSTIVLTTARSILQLSLLILIGIFAFRIKLIRKEGILSVNNILLHLALPATLLHSFQMEILFENKELLLSAFILSIMFMALNFVLAYIIVPRGPGCQAARASVAFTNNGFIGIPLLTAIYGDIGTFYASVSNVVGCIYVFGMLPLVLSGSFSLRDLVTKSLNDKMIVCLIAMLLLFADIRLPEFFMAPVGNLASMTTPLALISVGTILAESHFRDMFSRRVIWFSCLRNLLLPVIAGLCFRFVSSDPVMLTSYYVLAATPTASLAVVYTEQAGLPTEEISGVFLLTTIASAFTIPLVVLIMSMI
ncbi:MAG: AEC family transporter [Lachnospiraceae bacterium]|nr:AEC family transporter [Lachnospiraceae bacterium]